MARIDLAKIAEGRQKKLWPYMLRKLVDDPANQNCVFVFKGPKLKDERLTGVALRGHQVQGLFFKKDLGWNSIVLYEADGVTPKMAILGEMPKKNSERLETPVESRARDIRIAARDTLSNPRSNPSSSSEKFEGPYMIKHGRLMPHHLEEIKEWMKNNYAGRIEFIDEKGALICLFSCSDFNRECGKTLLHNGVYVWVDQEIKFYSDICYDNRFYIRLVKEEKDASI